MEDLRDDERKEIDAAIRKARNDAIESAAAEIEKYAAPLNDGYVRAVAEACAYRVRQLHR